MNHGNNAGRVWPLLLTVCLVPLTGCAKALVTTSVNRDGSWSRTLKFTAPRHDKPNTVTTGPSVQEAFALPKEGLWKTRWERDKDNVSYIAEKTLRPGDVEQQGLVVQSGQHTPELVTEATVRQVTPGTWRYQEVLHWKGGPSDEALHLDNPEALGNIKKALPPLLATDDNARRLAKSVVPAVWQALWGPPEPLVSQLMTHPDLAGELLQLRLGRATDEALRAQFGNRLTDADRTEVERKLFASITESVQTQGSAHLSPGADAAADTAGESGADQKKGNDAPPVALTFVTRVPGKLVSTNGVWNPTSQEVFWGLYPEAAQLGDVTLTATFQAAK